MDWYYSQGGQRFGPIEEPEMRRLATIGRIQQSDLVWCAGFSNWRPAREVEVVFPRSMTPPPLPPPSPPPVPFLSGPAVTPVPSPPETSSPAAATYAGFGLRLGAFLIDLLILLPLSVGLGFLLGLLSAAFGNPDYSTLQVAGNIFGILLNWLYYAGLESSPQMATFGKRALGLVVTDLQGGQISFARATGRHFAKFLSAIILCIGYLSIVYSPRKQGWHDQLASCLVLRARRTSTATAH